MAVLLRLTLLLVLLGSSGTRAFAQDAASYDGTILEAIAEFERANYEEAFALFAAAHALRPSARTLRGMGISAFEAKHYAAAVEFLSSSLQDVRRPLTPAQREEAQAALSKAQGFVARVAVALQPEGAELQVDGKPVQLGRGDLLLDAGLHELRFALSGHRDERRLLRLRAGEKVSLEVMLEPLSAPSLEASEPPRAVTDAAGLADGTPPRDARRRRTQLAMILAGEVAIGAGILTALRAAASRQAAEADCEQPCTAHAGRAQRRATYALLPLGVASVVGGSLWWIADVRRTRALQGAAACGPGGCGVSLHLHF